MSRRTIAAIVVAAVVISAVSGWIAARNIRSPAEIAARTAPPDASPILVPVEERVLTTDVVARGTARFGSPRQLTSVTSALKPDNGIVTTLAAPGAQLMEGDVLLTAAGRPVFLLTGDRIGMRDLGPGLQGEDVRQLEDALVRLGFDPGAVDGTYDGATESAVAAWYQAAGFAPFRATEDQLATIRSREGELTTARLDLHASHDSLSSAQAGLTAAQAAHATALATQAIQPAAIAAAQADAAAANQTAQAEVAAKAATLDDLITGGGSRAAIDAARAELTAAQANAESQRLAGDLKVAEALAASTVADNEVTSTAAAVAAAEQAQANAGAAVQDQRSLTGLAALEADLAHRRAGVQVPADELIFVPGTPVRVKESLVAPGDPLTGVVMSVTDAVVAVDGALPLEHAAVVRPGMTVQIDEPDLGIDATGTISQVAATPGTNGVDGFHIWFEVVVDGAPPNVVGASLRLTVPVESTSGSVLAVPTSAVSLAADGTSRVERDDGGFVTVEPGLSADGFVEVRPVQGTLAAGDLVVVGVDQSRAQAGG